MRSPIYARATIENRRARDEARRSLLAVHLEGELVHRLGGAVEVGNGVLDRGLEEAHYLGVALLLRDP